MLAPYPALVGNPGTSTLDFPRRLAALYKEYSLTQAQLAERIGIHAVQLRGSEAGTSQPTLDVSRKLATTLGVSADMLLFGKDERGPDDVRMQFEAVIGFNEEKRAVRSLLEETILKRKASRWQALSSGSDGKDQR